MATTATERRLLVDGKWIETSEWLEVRSPFDDSVVGRVASGGVAETRQALDAAERAMSEPLPAHERAAILDHVAAALAERHDEVARTISAEAGKPMKAARVEASRAVSTYTMAAVEARKLAGDVVPMDASPAGEGKLAFTLRTPVGIVAAISPFNFPLNLVAHKIAPALAAGCAVVLKPASQTPLSALLLAELEQEAGLPAGWLNVVCGPAREIGDVLVEDERVALITFTGSSGVGWKLRERAPRKRVNLELGNATPVVVAADADLDDAVARLAANAFSFAGQSCISVQRIYVERPAYDGFLERFLSRIEGLVVGDPADYDTLDEAIELCNGTRYGLQAGVFTQDVKAALHAARELDFGGVTVNEAPTFRADQMPYGGVKDSGNTREGPAYAVRELTEERVVVIQLPAARRGEAAAP